jgi:hypothetical protein
MGTLSASLPPSGDMSPEAKGAPSQRRGRGPHWYGGRQSRCRPWRAHVRQTARGTRFAGSKQTQDETGTGGQGGNDTVSFFCTSPSPVQARMQHCNASLLLEEPEHLEICLATECRRLDSPCQPPIFPFHPCSDQPLPLPLRHQGPLAVVGVCAHIQHVVQKVDAALVVSAPRSVQVQLHRHRRLLRLPLHPCHPLLRGPHHSPVAGRRCKDQGQLSSQPHQTKDAVARQKEVQAHAQPTAQVTTCP